MGLKNLSSLLLSLAAFCVLQPAHATFILSGNPNVGSVEVAQSIDLQIQLNATLGDTFIGFQDLGLTFDSTLLQFNINSSNIDPIFDFLQIIRSGSGNVTLTGLVGLPPPPAPLSPLSGLNTLATVNFTGLAPGTVNLALNAVDAILRPFPPGPPPVSADVTSNPTINVVAGPGTVPVPATLALALVGLLAMRRFR